MAASAARGEQAAASGLLAVFSLRLAVRWFLGRSGWHLLSPKF